jgi:hypothetical protein
MDRRLIGRSHRMGIQSQKVAIRAGRFAALGSSETISVLASTGTMVIDLRSAALPERRCRVRSDRINRVLALYAFP